MRIDILYPQVPPVFDAIGEHNRELATALARQGVSVGLIHASRQEPAPIDGVDMLRLSGDLPNALRALPRVVAGREPDWLITAYNPFSYGSHGLSLELPIMLRRLRKQVPRTALALYAHETLVPCRTPRLLVLSLLQRVQLRAVAAPQDLVLMSTVAWADRFRSWWPGTPTGHIPIGSNLPTSRLPRDEARRRLGIGPVGLVVTVFGGLGHDRDLSLVSAALDRLADQSTTLLYLGSDGPVAERLAAQAGVRIVNLGRAERFAAADALVAADIGLALFIGGVSARRGSFLALLQQGVPTVATHGPLTGAALSGAAADGCFEICTATPDDVANGVARLADSQTRAHVGARGRTYYERRHSWSEIAAEYIRVLSGAVQGSDVVAPGWQRHP